LKKSLYLYSIVAGLGGFLFGFDTAVVNGALPYFREFFQISKAIEGWVVSSALVGCLAGAASIGYFGDRYGRREMLKFMGLLMVVSAIGSGLANDTTTFVVFRIIGGLGVGGASVLSPMYITEISPAKFRGRLTIIFQMAIVIGILAAFASDLALINIGKNNWRWMFIVEAIPGLTFTGLLFFVVRSPRWLVAHGRNDEAKKVIETVNTVADSELVLDEISKSIDEDIIQHYGVLFKKPYFRLILIGIVVGMLNQFTGINVVMYYSTDIFRSAGFSTESGIIQTIIIGATNLAFTILAMSLIDKIGRKTMLLIGALFMSVFLAFLSWFFLSQTEGYAVLLMLILFVAFFAFSQGAVIWVILSEMFPNNIRARATSIGSTSLWFFCALTTFLFPVIKDSFKDNSGVGYIFAFYAVMTLFSFFFFKKYLVETKGKTLEELEKEVLK